MNLLELLRDADRKLDHGEITIGEYEKMIAPLKDAVSVTHGRWINGKCDKCGGHAPFWAMATTYYPSKFCPNCGARMDGK